MMTRVARPICRSLILVALLPLAACVTLMAPYDEKTDEMATALQRKVSEHFETLEGSQSPACLHQNFVQFYDGLRVDASALDVRARALDMNSQTQIQAAELMSMINNFEALHKLDSARGDCLSSDELSPLRRGFDSAVGAILKLEVAKKRGQK